MPNGPQQSCARASLLLRVVLLVFGGQMVAFYVLQILFRNRDSVFAVFVGGGWDYEFFYRGAQAWLAGRDPYAVPGFVTPPLSLLVPSLLSHLSLDGATLVFVCGNLVLVPLSLWWYARTLRLQRRERVLLLLVVPLFISAEECMRGGNMDGLMFALLVAAFSVRHRLTRAFGLAASMAIKLYSIILLPVALRRRQWRFAALTAAVTLILLFPFYRLWPSALHSVSTRNARDIRSSIAPSTLILALFGANGKIEKGVFLGFWVITFIVALYRDHGNELTPRTLARYIPWMFAFPPQVFSYEAVLALAVLASIAATACERPLRRAEYCCFCGFLLLGIHVEYVTRLLPLSYGTYQFFWKNQAVVQSLGVVLMVLGACLSPCPETSRPECNSPHIVPAVSDRRASIGDRRYSPES
jgi:hypothetical protein